MYVTCSGLAFYAKIFGRVTKEFIPFARVRCIRKRGGGFVANAIKVEFCDGAPAVVFGSLNKRERALAFITLKLCAANPMALRANQIEDDDGGSWEEDSVDYRSKSVPASVAARKMRKDAEDEDETVRPGQEGLERAQTDGQFLHKTSAGMEEMRNERKSQGREVEGSSGGLPPVSRKEPKMKEPFKGMWRVEDDVVDRVSGQAYGAKVEQARRVVQAPVEKVFDMLFAGDWLVDVNSKIGNTELTETPWARGDDGFMTRTFEFSRALGYRIGPKATRVVETHRYSFTSAGGAVFETSGHNLDVPLGDSFRVEGYLELSPASGGRATMIVASVAIHFTKSSILKSKIESGAIAETKDTYTRLLDLADLKVNTEAAEDAVLPSPNMRRDASFNKRSSDALAMQFRPSVAPDSPTKKYRHHQRSPSCISRAAPGQFPPLHIPPLQPAHAAAAGLPASFATAPLTVTSSGSRVGEMDFGLRVIIVLLLVVIVLLLVICAISLSNLRIDVIRLEKLATLAMEKGDIATAADACATR